MNKKSIQNNTKTKHYLWYKQLYGALLLSLLFLQNLTQKLCVCVYVYVQDYKKKRKKIKTNLAIVKTINKPHNHKRNDR